MWLSKTLALFFIILFPFTSLVAQEETLDDVRLLHNPSNTLFISNETETKGSPLYNKEWENGTVYFASGAKSKPTQLIYNSFTKELLFKDKNENIRKLDTSKLKGFSFDERNEKFVFGYTSSEYNFDEKNALRVIYDGKTKLLVLHQTAKQSGNSKDPLTGKVVDRFLSFETFLIRHSNGDFVKTRIRKKNLLNDLGTNKKEIESFLKKSKNKVKSENDAAKIIEFYDTLN